MIFVRKYIYGNQLFIRAKHMMNEHRHLVENKQYIYIYQSDAAAKSNEIYMLCNAFNDNSNMHALFFKAGCAAPLSLCVLAANLK